MFDVILRRSWDVTLRTTWVWRKHFFKWSIASSFFFIFVFSTGNSKCVHYKKNLMVGFEPQTSDTGCDHSADWATTSFTHFCKPHFFFALMCTPSWYSSNPIVGSESCTLGAPRTSELLYYWDFFFFLKVALCNKSEKACFALQFRFLSWRPHLKLICEAKTCCVTICTWWQWLWLSW